ncbi:MAG: putative quinol monooxygenase [Ilumatobacter sp.]|uniref:putative quinol monooxygenase n=1 Tax=Ilumatobacter sp. TaxID=1967498 RepID=UPI003297B863
MATIIAKSDKVEETKAALSSLVAPTNDEAGCISYELFQSNDDPTEFVTVEEWTDQAAIDSHMGSDHIAAALGAAPDILGADPKITSYTKIS